MVMSLIERGIVNTKLEWAIKFGMALIDWEHGHTKHFGIEKWKLMSLWKKKKGMGNLFLKAICCESLSRSRM